MEQVEGFIKLPIKSMTPESVEAIQKEYDKYYEKVEEMENLGIKPDNLQEPEIDEDKYTEMIDLNVRPESIIAYKRASDGNVDVSTDSILSYSRVYMKYEEFVELLKSTK